MKYLNSTFTVQSPENTEGLACPRCVFGEKWGEHVEGCGKRGNLDLAALQEALRDFERMKDEASPRLVIQPRFFLP